MEWKPMKLAPADCSILVCDARSLDGCHEVVYYDERMDDPYCWATSDGIRYHRERFTHWMPLPEPPPDDDVSGVAE